jgi:hypothetical protein
MFSSAVEYRQTVGGDGFDSLTCTALKLWKPSLRSHNSGSKKYGDMAKLVNASGCQPDIRPFKSGYPRTSYVPRTVSKNTALLSVGGAAKTGRMFMVKRFENLINSIIECKNNGNNPNGVCSRCLDAIATFKKDLAAAQNAEESVGTASNKSTTPASKQASAD